MRENADTQTARFGSPAPNPYDSYKQQGGSGFTGFHPAGMARTSAARGNTNCWRATRTSAIFTTTAAKPRSAQKWQVDYVIIKSLTQWIQ